MPLGSRPILTSSSDEQNKDQRPHGCCVILWMRGLHLDPWFIWSGQSLPTVVSPSSGQSLQDTPHTLGGPIRKLKMI